MPNPFSQISEKGDLGLGTLSVLIGGENSSAGGLHVVPMHFS